MAKRIDHGLFTVKNRFRIVSESHIIQGLGPSSDRPSLEAQTSGGRHGELGAAGAVAVGVVELPEGEGTVRKDLVAADQEFGAGPDLAPVCCWADLRARLKLLTAFL